MSELADKPLRADARRNREKVLAAARAVFAEQGVDAQMDDVARRADVGVGTVYRHFPTKDALLNALTDELFDASPPTRARCSSSTIRGRRSCRRCGSAREKTAGDRAFAEILAASRNMIPTECPGKEELTRSVAEMMARRSRPGGCAPTS